MRIILRALLTISLALACLIPPAGPVRAQLVSPAPGVDYPQGYYDTISRNPRAFQLQRAWFERTRKAKEAREQFLASVGTGEARYVFESLPQSDRASMVVSGTFAIPVIMFDYSNVASVVLPAGLQAKMFDNAAGTVTAYYNEVSGGNLTVTGTVFGPVQLPNTDAYYEGGYSGVVCGISPTGELISQALDLIDGSVDFGQFDNDGPDGVPNSGDDDGFVDLVLFAQPEIGGECGGGNIISHHYVTGGWPYFGSDCTNFGNSYLTNDPAFGGGNIQVWDYSIVPQRGSGSAGLTTDGCGTGTSEIGVWCHEIGHGFGLPDLYDRNGGFGKGVGRHVLMGAGNWNRPANPVHMSAWSKAELGWVIPQVVGPQEQLLMINDVETTGEVYRFNVYDEKFRRTDYNTIGGSYALNCALTPTEAGVRGFLGGAGYGNRWKEAVRHDFAWDGSTPVNLNFITVYDLETDYDYGYIKIRVNGTESTVQSYTGSGVDNPTIDLSPWLNGTGATAYQLVFELESDLSWSDEDGDFDSQTGPFRIDNVSVTGGGVAYSTDFESYEDGWYNDFADNPVQEFFLVENRNTANGIFDQYIFGSGLYIWHIEQNMAHSRLVNDGNPNQNTINPQLPYAVKVVEADGNNQLVTGASWGDIGDPYPGLSSNRNFTNSTTPTSRGYSTAQNNIAVQSISDPATTMTALMRGGRRAPSITSINPNIGPRDDVVSVDILGDRFVHGATVALSGPVGPPPALATAVVAGGVAASSVEWIGKVKLTAELDLTGMTRGPYDVVITNPDGQTDTLAGAFTVDHATPVFVQAFDATVDGQDVILTWDVFADESFTGFKIMRLKSGESAEVPIHGESLLPPETRRFVDDTAEAGATWEYALVVVLADGSELRSQRVSAETLPNELALYQNRPNPFNPTTTIRFSLPKSAPVQLTVYDALGRRVATLVNGPRPAGFGEVIWDGHSDAGGQVSSGVYFYRLETGTRVLTRKLILLR